MVVLTRARKSPCRSLRIKTWKFTFICVSTRFFALTVNISKTNNMNRRHLAVKVVINYHLYLYSQNKMVNSLPIHPRLSMYLHLRPIKLSIYLRQLHVLIHKSSLAGVGVMSARRLSDMDKKTILISIIWTWIQMKRLPITRSWVCPPEKRFFVTLLLENWT